MSAGYQNVDALLTRALAQQSADCDTLTLRTIWSDLGAQVDAMIRSVAWRIGAFDSLLNYAEDVRQDILLHLQDRERLARIASHPTPTNYVVAMVRSRLLDRLRRSRTWSSDAAIPAERSYFEAEDRTLPEGLRAALREIFSALEPRDRELLRCLYADEEELLSHRAIGERLGMTPSNVAQRHRRILLKLREALRVHEQEWREYLEPG